MKPFLILQHRYLDEASDNEYEAILQYGCLTETQTHRIRMDKGSIGNIDLDQYSGILIGGGPGNVSDRQERKRNEQIRFEHELSSLYDTVFAWDFPYLGICYGMGSVTAYLDGKVTQGQYSEAVGAVDVTLTDEGKDDPLMRGVPDRFRAFVGHKESCQFLPKGCTHLAKSETCPFQMIRYGQNIYATQFHPELDIEGLNLRIDIYKNHGYFSPDRAEYMKVQNMKEKVIFPQVILENFIQKYRID